MIQKKVTFFLLLLMSVSFLGQAQEKLSLAEAINYALENKAAAQKAALEVEKSKYLVTERKAAALPHINGSGGLVYNPILRKTPIPGDFIGQPGQIFMVPFGQPWNSSIGVNLKQMLFNSKVFIGMKAARESRDLARISREMTDEQIIEKVATAYYQILTQQQKLQTIDSSYASALKIHDIIKNLYQNGLAKEIDLDRISVNLTNLKTARTQLSNAVIQLKNALKFYMGMPMNNPVQLSFNDLEIEPQYVPKTIDVSERTEIQLLKKKKQLLTYKVQAEKSGLYPTLYLIGSYAWQGFGDKFPIGTGESQGTYWTDYASIGLQINIPIFNGMGTRAAVKQAEIELENVALDIQDTKLAMNLEYQNAKAQIENSLKSIENQKANKVLAHKVLKNTRNNYQNGLATLTDLLDAQNAWVEAKNNYTHALLKFKLAEIKLYKAKGKLEKFVQQLND